ncbi:hypothetical protein [Alkalimarinus alittae]|uniref:Uncharacterized protein n=1 Tax=Alkalimarinus alittae TaxID=2961619 RepID=A0ABY6N255_9ALTE|nr:hypothetical protein [Alkalimarinus alittae]UZE96105.1 hypothetical protein NKI27_18980 [Alkalimarinus alittae]
MQGASAPIPTSEKTFLYLSAAKNHLGLVITFIVALLIPLGGIAIGIAGNEILLIPIIVGLLFFIIPYFMLSMLKSTIKHEYEVALVNQFGIKATGIVSHKYIEDTSHFFDRTKHYGEDGEEKLGETTYFIEYKYAYDKAYKSVFDISRKALYESIEVGSTVPIKLLASAPCKSAPRREDLAVVHGFNKGDCQ